MSYKVFTTEYTIALAGAITRAENLAIDDNQRFFKVNSVFWDYSITDTSINKNVSIDNNIDLIHWMRIGDSNISPIGFPLRVVSGAYTINGGLYFRLFNIGQLKFDSFFMSNIIQCRLMAINTNAAKNYEISGSIVFEITDEIIF